MKDKARKAHLHNMGVGKLHGHTVIELHNHRTGSRERIESDNTFTDGIENYLLSSGWFDNSPFRNDTWRGQALYRSLVGGVLLFDKEIEAVNGVYPTIMPAGTKMVANGSYGVTNNSAVTEMGSYNSNESSFTNNVLTFVYDWSTSQGNGDIGCISLTSDIGGFVGYGNSVSQVAHTTLKSLTENQDSNTFLVEKSGSYAFFMKGDTVYYALSASEDDENLIFYSKKIGIDDEVTLFNGEVQHSVPIPSSVATGSGYLFVMTADVGFAVVNLPNEYSWTDTHGLRPLAIYNILTNTWTMHTAKAYYDCRTQGQYASVVVDDMINVQGVGGGTDGSVLTKLDTGDNLGGSNSSSLFVKIADNLYIRRTPDGTSTQIFDKVNNTTYPINASNSSYNYYGKENGQLGIDRNRIMATAYGNRLRIYRNPLYLATVANLDNTVTKTSSQTMKLIYTVTRV